jgi:hypothetical protein
MTSKPDWNRAGFAFVARELAAQGETVINPHDLHPEPPPWTPGADKAPGFADLWKSCLREDVGQLVRCDRVVALPGWRASPGARVEVMVAHLLGIKVETWPDGKRLACDAETARLCVRAALAISDIVGSNSASHGGHLEWRARTPQYHTHKVAGHAVTAAAQLAGEKGRTDGEGAADHIERCLVRSAMALARIADIG